MSKVCKNTGLSTIQQRPDVIGLQSTNVLPEETQDGPRQDGFEHGSIKRGVTRPREVAVNQASTWIVTALIGVFDRCDRFQRASQSKVLLGGEMMQPYDISNPIVIGTPRTIVVHLR